MYGYDTEKLKRALDGLRIHELRELGGIVGVRSPSSQNFGVLRDSIIDIVTGRTGAEQKSSRGRPKKSGGDEHRYRKLLDGCRTSLSELEYESGEAAGAEPEEEYQYVYPAAPIPPVSERKPGKLAGGAVLTAPGGFALEYHYLPAQPVLECCQNQIGFDEEEEPEFEEENAEFEGILEILPDGGGFVRRDFCEGAGDAHVSAALIKRFKLKKGDLIRGGTAGRYQAKFPEAASIAEVNGGEPGGERREFEQLFPLRPRERLRLSLPGEENVILRYLDLFAPVGKGQRGLIFASPHTGRTTVFSKIARGIARNCPEVALIAVLVDKKPEDAAEFARDFPGEVACSAFGERAFRHIRAAELALERAKRLAESGKDVVLLLDNATRLARAYNLAAVRSNRPLAGGLEPAAAEAVKKFVSEARNTEGGGSLTVLAAVLTETGSPLDKSLCDELAGCENMRLVLDAALAREEVFPAVDLKKSSTDRTEMLLSSDEREAARKALGVLPWEPKEAALALWKRLKNTANNADFVRQIIV